MTGNLRALSIMLLAPPALLLLWAHLVRPYWPDTDWFALILAGLIGALGAFASSWQRHVKIGIAVIYIVVATFLMPWVGLLAVCFTGDCL